MAGNSQVTGAQSLMSMGEPLLALGRPKKGRQEPLEQLCGPCVGGAVGGGLDLRMEGVRFS